MNAPIDRDLALENARLRERIAELEHHAVLPVDTRAAAPAPRGVRYGLDGMPQPTTTRRTFGRLIAFLLFLFGIGLGFGFGSRQAFHDFQSGVRDGFNDAGGAVSAPAVPPGK